VTSTTTDHQFSSVQFSSVVIRIGLT